MQASKEISLVQWIEAAESGGEYAPHQASKAGGFGRVIEPLAASVEPINDPALLAGGQLLTIEEALRPPLVLAKAGAQVVEEVDRGVSTIGSLSQGAEAAWLIDGVEHSATVMKTRAADLGGAIVTARVDASRRFRKQVRDAEQLLRRELQAAMRAATEQAVFAGTGVEGAPAGLANEQAFHLETGPIDPLALLSDVQLVLDEGCDPERVAVFASSADFKNIMCFGSPYSLNHQSGMATTGAIHNIGGIGIRFTPYLAQGEAITGQFDFLTVTYYDRPELLVNPYIHAANGGVRIQGWQGIGFAVSHTNAFIRRRAA